MRVGFVGDIVGRAGREMIKKYLRHIRDEYNLDIVIANGENATHGFGLSFKHGKELMENGADIITGGNHSFDNDGIKELFKAHKNVLRPHNYHKGLDGNGIYKFSFEHSKIAVVNLMGHFAMPQCDNAFVCAQKIADDLIKEGINAILVDFHAEATAEKRVLFTMLKGKVNVIVGTHTHIGTDDLIIEEGTFYVSDIGLSGNRGDIIGMHKDEPINRSIYGVSKRFKVSNDKATKKIFQMIVVDIKDGKAINAFKIKIFGDLSNVIKIDAINEDKLKL